MQGTKVEAAPREEERQRGAVSRGMYLTYVRAWGPWMVLPVTFLIVTLFGKSLEVRTFSHACAVRSPWGPSVHEVSSVQFLTQGTMVGSSMQQVVLWTRACRCVCGGVPQDAAFFDCTHPFMDLRIPGTLALHVLTIGV